MNRFLLGLGATLWMTAIGVAIGAGNAADERLEVLGNVKLLGTGNGVIFPDGSKLTRAMSNGTNTALGADALINPPSDTTNGYLNTAVGWAALNANTTGHHNTAVGGGALGTNTYGYHNTAVGNLALNQGSGVENTAIGMRAMELNQTGFGNTAVGADALRSANAARNTAIGLRALANYEGNGTGGGNFSIAIGDEAGINLVRGSNAIYVGNKGVDGDLNVIRIGSYETGLFHLRTFIAGIRGTTTGSSNTAPVLIDANGQLGTTSSSRRYKEDIHDMGAASAALMQLRPVTFRYTRAYADGSKPIDYGLVAEEVAEVYPDLIVYGADGQIESVQYHKLTPLLLNELQRQYRRIAEFEAQNAALLKRLAALEATVGATPQK